MMCDADPRQPAPSRSRAAEAGLPRYEPSLDPSATSSSPLLSSPATITSSSTTLATSVTKKQRWYKSKLRIKLNIAWIWGGSIRAGHAAPMGQEESVIAKDVDEAWEQLPPYTPLAEGSRARIERSDRVRRERGDWLIGPPSTESGSLGGGDAREDPPPYR